MTSTDLLAGLSTSVAVKAPCKAVAIANITLSGEQTVNGVAVVSGDRVLVTAQTSSVDNGIYVASTSAWQRATDFDGNRDVRQGTLVVVNRSTGQDYFYQVDTANPITIGTSAITFTLTNDPNVSFDVTPEETAAGVTPVNTSYEAGNIRRYGGSTTATAAVNDQAIADALASAMVVRVPFEGDGRYDVTRSFTLGLRGQQVIGVGTGNHLTASQGVVLNVVSGFPTSGGDAAQAVLNITDRFQSVQNLTIRCNSIALHGIYGTGSDVTRLYCRQLSVSEPTGSAYMFKDSTFMNTFELCEAPSPGTYGFDFDATNSSAGHTTITLINCYTTSPGTAGFRFDAVTGFSMISCACDNGEGYGIVALAGSIGTVDSWDQENTWQIIDASDQAILPSRVTFVGCRFLNLGDASSPARLIYNGGTLTFENCQFNTVGTHTAFLEQLSGSQIRWFGNGLDIRTQTNTINSASAVHSDTWVRQSNVSATSERFIVEAASTPRVHLRETGGSSDSQMVIEAGVFKVQRINATTFAAEQDAITLNLSTGNISISPGSGNDLTLGGQVQIGGGADSVGFFGATPATKLTVTGSRGGNAALASLLTHLETYGAIVDSSS